jgi:hypothetical protein
LPVKRPSGSIVPTLSAMTGIAAVAGRAAGAGWVVAFAGDSGALSFVALAAARLIPAPLGALPCCSFISAVCLVFAEWRGLRVCFPWWAEAS